MHQKHLAAAYKLSANHKGSLASAKQLGPQCAKKKKKDDKTANMVKNLQRSVTRILGWLTIQLFSSILKCFPIFFFFKFFFHKTKVCFEFWLFIISFVARFPFLLVVLLKACVHRGDHQSQERLENRGTGLFLEVFQYRFSGGVTLTVLPEPLACSS